MANAVGRIEMVHRIAMPAKVVEGCPGVIEGRELLTAGPEILDQSEHHVDQRLVCCSDRLAETMPR